MAEPLHQIPIFRGKLIGYRWNFRKYQGLTQGRQENQSYQRSSSTLPVSQLQQPNFDIRERGKFQHLDEKICKTPRKTRVAKTRKKT